MQGGRILPTMILTLADVSPSVSHRRGHDRPAITPE
jgi:hypothetical protein